MTGSCIRIFLIRKSMDILVTPILLSLFTWFLQVFSRLNELSQIQLSAPFATGIRGKQKADFMEKTTV